MRQFRRIKLRTAAQKRCPPSFTRRMLAAYATSPFPIGYSRAMIGHDPRCKFVRGGPCDCVPHIHLTLPDGRLVEVDHDGGVKWETRH
jgi:hypothetical protein